jgi:hypothetical protein
MASPSGRYFRMSSLSKRDSLLDLRSEQVRGRPGSVRGRLRFSWQSGFLSFLRSVVPLHYLILKHAGFDRGRPRYGLVRGKCGGVLETYALSVMNQRSGQSAHCVMPMRGVMVTRESGTESPERMISGGR